MTLALDSQQVVDGLWVFDAYVVVRTTNKRFLFFEKPLLAGEKEQPMTQIQNEFRTSEVSFISEEFGRNEQNQTQAFLYGVAEGKLYRYVFDIDLENRTVEISDRKIQPNVTFSLTGSFIKSLVNQNYFIVSCGDCLDASV